MSIDAPLTQDTLLGIGAGPLVHIADSEWLMGYAAAIGDYDPRYFDTTRADGIAAHPLFPVCLEWPAWLQALRNGLSPASNERGVHATHELHYHRPLRCGETLHTQARIDATRQRRSGLHLTTTLTTRDDAGHVVFVSRSGLLLRGVHSEDAGDDADSNADLLPTKYFADDTIPVRWSTSQPLDAGLAHVYSACARIWNPIHTDAAVAQRAGLPGIILHGTATLALTISELLRHDGNHRPVSHIAARFLAPVPLPSTLRIECLDHGDSDATQTFRTRLENSDTTVCIGTLSYAEDE